MVMEKQQYLCGLEKNNWHRARSHSVLILDTTTPYRSLERAKTMSVFFILGSFCCVYSYGFVHVAVPCFYQETVEISLAYVGGKKKPLKKKEKTKQNYYENKVSTSAVSLKLTSSNNC